VQNYEQVIPVLFLGGIIGLMFKIVFDWLKNRKNAKSSPENNPSGILSEIADNVRWLKTIHNQYSNGRPVWYVSEELIKQLKAISDRTLQMDGTLKEILKEVEGMKN